MNSTESAVIEGTLCKEVIINAPVSKVWKALTEKEQIDQWFMPPENFKPEIGNTFKMTGSKDGVSYPHTCTITEIIPEKILAYTWSISAIDGETLVTWELQEMNSGTKLTLTHSNWDKVKFNTTAISTNDYINGWNHFTNKLKEYSETL
ncbi:MAG: SRPBCC domain-containing protein [Bacteroidetes bacterium]|nr:SRPBCC domain-containing protein [Bacteroidota bacterium]